MPPYLSDLWYTPPASEVIHLDSVDPIEFSANFSAKRSAIAHERARERGEVMVFFSVYSAKCRIVALHGVVASLDLNDNDSFFLKGYDVGLKPR
jgi:hypothetical protein